MTEDDWHKGEDWLKMLAFASGTSSKRKNTLYVCAGLRQIWEWLYHDSSRKGVEVAERAADDLANQDEINRTAYDAEVPTFGHDLEPEHFFPQLDDGGYNRRARQELGIDFDDDLVLDKRFKRLIDLGVYTAENIRRGRQTRDDEICSRILKAANIAESCLCITEGEMSKYLTDNISTLANWPGVWLVREIYGNPFKPVAIHPEWLAWDGGTVPALAEGIYDERAFNRLPILADALEDAGCDEAVILDHCRQPGDHARGCWVIDSLLGRR